jgi:hypothetical protein
MTQPIDVERLIVANPGVDRARLESVRALLAELLAKGLWQRPQYRLAEPFATRPVRRMSAEQIKQNLRRALRQGR